MSVSELIRCRLSVVGINSVSVSYTRGRNSGGRNYRFSGYVGNACFRDMSEMRVFGICRNYVFSARYQIRSRIGITGIRELSKLDLGLFCVT